MFCKRLVIPHTGCQAVVVIKRCVMNKYFIFLTFVCLSVFANAQHIKTRTAPYEMDAKPVSGLTRTASDYVPWGYCDNDVQFGIGVGEKSSMGAAILVSRDDLGAYRNADIVGIRFGLAAASENTSVFIKTGDADNLSFDLPNAKEEYVGSAAVGFTEVLFDEPFRTTDDFLIVGYTGTGEGFVGFDGGLTNADACYIYLDGVWGTVYEQAVSGAWGSLSIQLLIGGTSMPEREISMVEVLTSYVEQNKPFVMQGVVANMTVMPVTEYEISYSANNGEVSTKSFTADMGAQETDTFEIEMPAFTQIGGNSVMVRVESVNGLPDEDTSNNTVVKSINCIEEGCFFQRTMVMEESTSVYCGYCPKGIVVMRSLSERYPDNFIGISVHSPAMGPDPMSVYDYDEYINGLYKDEGLPNSILNRKTEYSGDPLYMDMYFESEMKFNPIAVADVEIVSVSGVNDNEIEVKTQTKFANDVSGTSYRLAYVLLENNVYSAQPQLNYFAGGSSMGGFEQLPSQVDMRHNDVARGIWDFNGIEGSIPSDVVKKEAYDFSYTLNLDDKTALVQDESALEVVVMIVDPVTGEILNADKKAVGYQSGLSEEVMSDGSDVVVYAEDGQVRVIGDYDRINVFNVSGVQVPNRELQDGVYVVMIENDGTRTVRKVLVR